MNLRWVLLRGQGSWVPWGNYSNIRTIAASKKARRNDLLLNGERASANGKSFSFFDPKNCPSFDDQQLFRSKLFNKNVEKFVEKPSRTSVTVRTANT
jgi:hypothetical protein